MISEPISLTLSAQVFSAPYAIMTMNTLSLGFVLSNMILLPIYSVVVIVGNIMALTMNFQLLFDLLAKILNATLFLLESGINLVLNFSPPVCYLSSMSAFYFIFIYIAFMLHKVGKKYAKFIPIFIIPILFVDNYKITPEIQYVSTYNKKCILVKYKADTYLIENKNRINKEKDKNFLDKNHVTNIISLNNESIKLDIGRKYSITFLPIEKNTNDDLMFLLKLPEKQVYFKAKEDISTSFQSDDSYDIMYLKTYSNNEILAKPDEVINTIEIGFGHYFLIN
jgi:Competence protein.